MILNHQPETRGQNPQIEPLVTMTLLSFRLRARPRQLRAGLKATWDPKSVLVGWNTTKTNQITIPICSMYGIFTYIWVISGANVGKCSIHGAYGIYINKWLWCLLFFLDATWVFVPEKLESVEVGIAIYESEDLSQRMHWETDWKLDGGCQSVQEFPEPSWHHAAMSCSFGKRNHCIGFLNLLDDNTFGLIKKCLTKRLAFILLKAQNNADKWSGHPETKTNTI